MLKIAPIDRRAGLKMRKELKIDVFVVALAAIVIFGFLAYTIYTERTAIENLEAKLTDVAVARKGLTSCDVALEGGV